MSSLESIFQNPLDLFTKALKKGSYFLRTGYWHTGERCCSDFPDENFVNHLKVYRFAAQFCRDKQVLDVGCGTGYGSSFLSASAASVIGIDLSRQAIRYARTHYRNSNLQFLRMNAESLKFAEQEFDLAISTENFEHLRDQRANLREMARVLKSDGMLLLATPNQEMFVGDHNPYHTHEFSYEEFLGIVQEYFDECLIAENLLEPASERGRRMREERKNRGAQGISLSSSPFLWGQGVDPTWLSNTHSFFCFARGPRRVA